MLIPGQMREREMQGDLRRKIGGRLPMEPVPPLYSPAVVRTAGAF